MTEHPDITAPLYGHDGAQQQLAQWIAKKQLPSAIMLAGQEGIGKALLGWKLAASLMSHPPQEDNVGLFGDSLPQTLPTTLAIDYDSPVLTRMQSGSHPDFLLLRPAWDEKKKAYKTEITVEQTRKIHEFLSLTAGEGGWKIILIDSADAMNNAASNALLKWLEEPPNNSLFILISHQLHSLLPTIISRCRVITLSRPSEAEFSRLIQADAQYTALLYTLCGGSVGLARHWQTTKWLAYWQDLCRLCISGKDAVALAHQLSLVCAKDTAFNLDSMCHLTDAMLGFIIKAQSHEVMPDDEQVRDAIKACAKRYPLAHWLHVWDDTRGLVSKANGLYLDKQQLLFNLLTLFA